MLMDRFKWTPADVRALSGGDYLRLMTMLRAEAKAQKAKGL
jgi:hypothetical protein